MKTKENKNWNRKKFKKIDEENNFLPFNTVNNFKEKTNLKIL